MSMRLISDNEHLVYHWKSENDASDSIAITDRRFYHHSKQKDGEHTCLLIKDIKMVKFKYKRVKREPILWLQILRALTLLSFLITFALFQSDSIVFDFLGLTDVEAKFIAVIAFCLFATILVLTRYVTKSVMEIEYGSGNKIDISMKTYNETIMYAIRNAIFDAIDFNDNYMRDDEYI